MHSIVTRPSTYFVLHAAAVASRATRELSSIRRHSEILAYRPRWRGTGTGGCTTHGGTKKRERGISSFSLDTERRCDSMGLQLLGRWTQQYVHGGRDEIKKTYRERSNETGRKGKQTNVSCCAIHVYMRMHQSCRAAQGSVLTSNYASEPGNHCCRWPAMGIDCAQSRVLPRRDSPRFACVVLFVRVL